MSQVFLTDRKKHGPIFLFLLSVFLSVCGDVVGFQ